MTIAQRLNLSELNLDGSHAIAKKGGESVAYQVRKKAKTSNILPITDGEGDILASTALLAGNHNEAYNLKPHLSPGGLPVSQTARFRCARCLFQRR